MLKEILIIDDAQEELELIRAMLHDGGYGVITAQNGKEGLFKAKTQSPALIILDVVMDGMDGFSVFKELKKDIKTATIPTIILTARPGMKDTFETFGANHFMIKPLNVGEFFAVIKKLLDSASSAATTRLSSISGTKQDPVANPVPDAPARVVSVSDTRLTASGHKKKALIFGTDQHTLGEMSQQLRQEGYHVVCIKDEQQLPLQVDTLAPSLVLLQVNAEVPTPIDTVVKALNDVINKKSSQKRPDGSFYSGSLVLSIVLFKAEKRIFGMVQGGENTADIGNMVDRCVKEGAKKYIGIYAPAVFISRIKPFLV